ncbi:MAG: haloacid dehalogenase [Rhodospirillales bacterium CG15_BIG_FIL_POST_REV_8_21_14_020_66_15]|nr:MAG: haloacid dehalogenase [Rhodospirillales bacterium CG15_BIG_FIL_POST_REV_8_21_14_020_66_15]
MNIKLCVFDCDGTIVDSQDSIVRSMQTAFRACGLEVPAPRDIRRVVGLPLATAALLLAPAGTDARMAENLAEAYRDTFSGLRRSGQIDDPLYPGVHAAVDALDAAGWLLGIATGKGRRGLDQTLERHGLKGRFVTLQTADSAPGKPDPGMLLNAMAEAGADRADTVMIGDTTFDIEMSKNAGVLAIGVAWGYHETAELTAAGAQRVIAGFEDLAPSLHELMEAEP